MKKTTTLVAVFVASCLLLGSAGAGTAAVKPPPLASYDWSVNGAHNLASNPPSLPAVQAFERRAFGASPDLDVDKVCEFRFADLRHSGNLSLVVTVDGGGTGGCNLLYIFDKTATGFELYSADGAVGDDLAKSVLDINHDGKRELVLWGYLAPAAAHELDCEADWPMIFAWTGNGYAEVSSQCKQYYQQYLKSLNKQMAAYSSRTEEAQERSAQTPKSEPMISPGHWGAGSGDATISGEMSTAQQATAPAPAASANAAPAPGLDDYDCDRIEAAKTEQFLGIHSDTSISAAIKGLGEQRS